jgi:site-specific DNA recombinase
MSTITAAAIYARKSTDDSDRDAANKSVTRQVEHAKAYAAKKGWTVADAHVYADDNVSGAEFENRPGFAKLIADLPKRRKPPFDVVIMSEASRFGRDQQRNGFYLAHLRDSGVRIFYYLDDSEEKLDTPEQVLMSSVKSYAAEVERIKAGQRSRDALTRKAAKGYNAGGVVYGYDNVQVFSEGGGEDAKKSHTDYKINPAQADVLRRMFRMYAAGHGHPTIAKTLNGDSRYAALSKRYFGGARPASPRKGTGSWAPSSVRVMLRNERYTGVVAYGLRRKGYRHGTKFRTRQPAAEVTRTPREDLRIIPAGLWREVSARMAVATKTYIRDTGGTLWGRPGVGVESKYLLTGLGRCGCCGRNITMVGGRGGSDGTRHPLFYYGCTHHKNRGDAVCSNDRRARMSEADALVIGRVREVLTPEAMDYAIDKAVALAAAKRTNGADDTERLATEARRLRKELDRLVRAVAEGTVPAAIVAEIARRETRLAEIDVELQALTMAPPSPRDLQALRDGFRERLGRFNELLVSDVPLARQALRKLIPGRIEFRPEDRDGARGYRLRWSLATTALMDGYLGVASPRGFEPRLSP